MRFECHFDMDNAAFEGPGANLELLHILNRVVAKVLIGETEGSCRDSNGNTVGAWSIKEGDSDG